MTLNSPLNDGQDNPEIQAEGIPCPDAGLSSGNGALDDITDEEVKKAQADVIAKHTVAMAKELESIKQPNTSPSSDKQVSFATHVVAAIRSKFLSLLY